MIKSKFAFHFVLIGITCGILFWKVKTKNFSILSPTRYQENYDSLINVRLLSSLEHGPATFQIFKENLLDTNTVVVIGSSEMGSTEISDTNIPYIFLPDKCGIPCWGWGHAGNQCFSILTQLSALAGKIEHSKLVVILSPGWFRYKYSKGTSTFTFLEYSNDEVLNSIIENEKLDPIYRNYIGNFVVKNYNDFVEPGKLIKELYKIGDEIGFNNSYSFMNKYAHYSTSYLEDIFHSIVENYHVENNQIEVPSKKINPDFITASFDSDFWSKRYEEAVSYERSKCTSNTKAINDEYYTSYFKSNAKVFDFKVEELSENQEFSDLKMLVNFLKKYCPNTLFVMQPLNPYAYKDLKKLEPTILEVEKFIKENDMNCFNMFVSDTTHYEKHVLTDVMHFGEPGWCVVNKEILTHFFHGK